MRLRRQHEGDAPGLLDPNGTVRKPVIWRANQMDVLPDKLAVDHPAIELTVADHAEIQLAVEKVAADMARPGLADLNAYLGIMGPCRIKQLRRDKPAKGERQADFDDRRRGTREGLKLPLGVLDAAQDIDRVGEELPSR